MPACPANHTSIGSLARGPNPNPIMAEEKKRYSDEELEEFRQLIQEKLDKAQKEYDEILSGIESKDDPTADRAHNIFEESSTVAQQAEAQRLAERQMQFMQKLQAALVRIENKTYGVCRVTGELIPKERLRAVPHATLSIEAKNRK